MGKPKRHRAISMTQNATFFLVSFAVSVYVCCKPHFFSDPRLVLLLAILIIVICYSGYYLIHPVYLTDYGVECCLFNKIYRKIPWCHITQVSIVRDLRWTSGVSNSPRIILTPINCEKYNKEWLGIKYLFIFRHQVIWIDYTKQNLRFIEQYHGEIMDFVYGDSV